MASDLNFNLRFLRNEFWKTFGNLFLITKWTKMTKLAKFIELTDAGLEKKIRYRTELAFCGQRRRLPTAHYLAAPDCIFQRTF